MTTYGWYVIRINMCVFHTILCTHEDYERRIRTIPLEASCESCINSRDLVLVSLLFYYVHSVTVRLAPVLHAYLCNATSLLLSFILGSRVAASIGDGKILHYLRDVGKTGRQWLRR